MIRILLTCIGLSSMVISGYTQCPSNTRVFLPAADRAYDGYGHSVASDGDYLVVTAPYNDSLAYGAGLVYLYRLAPSQQWMKIAELMPSDLSPAMSFGTIVSISGNSIVVWGRAIHSDGTDTQKLYIYEKPAGGEWSTGTESYQIQGPDFIGEFVVKGDELFVIEDYSTNLLRIYKKTVGVFVLSQTIAGPRDKNGNSEAYDCRLAVGDDLIVIGNDQFNNADNTTGIVFVFQKSGGVYGTSPVARFKPASTGRDYIGFGASVGIHDRVIFVGASSYLQAGIYRQAVMIFREPVSGWVDAVESERFISDKYLSTNNDLLCGDDYVLFSSYGTGSILGFKKTGTDWSSGVIQFEIGNPVPGSLFGRRINVVGDHLIANAAALSDVAGSAEVVVDFYRPARDWENAGVPDQILRETTVNATLDEFGEVLSSHGKFLIVGASGDDETGEDTGAVYIFDTSLPGNDPVQKLFSPRPGSVDNFGVKVAAGDGSIFVTSLYEDSLRNDGSTAFNAMGKVYVFRQTQQGWRVHSQVVSPVVKSEGYFGQQIVYHRGYLAITEFYTGSSESRGRVHIYKEGSDKRFTYLATLRPSEDMRSDFFGRNIVMNDSTIVVGTGSSEINVSYRLKVFVYTKKRGEEWRDTEEDAKLTSSDKGWNDAYGFDVDMEGDYIVVSAPRYPGIDPRPLPQANISRGSVYIYKKPINGWRGTITEIAKLLPSDPSDYNNFGYSVEIDGDDIFIGAPHSYSQRLSGAGLIKDPLRIKTGRVYHYVKPNGEWVSTNREHRQIFSSTPDLLDTFGSSLLVLDRQLYIGSEFDDTEVGFQSGSVQTIMLSPRIVPLSSPLCSETQPVQLHAVPGYGTWSGDGVNAATGTFDPRAAGAGTHTITYNVPGCAITIGVDVEDFELDLLGQSPAIQAKCIDQPVSLEFNTDAQTDRYTWFFKVTEDEVYQQIDAGKKQILVSQPGFYEAQISHDVCPAHKVDFLIKDDAIDIEIPPVPTVCSDDLLTVEASPTGGYWSGVGVTAGGLLDPGKLTDGPIALIYRVTSPIGCVFKDSIILNIDKLILPRVFQEGVAICAGSPSVVKLSPLDVRTEVQWFSVAANSKVGTDPDLIVTKPGDYYARVFKHACFLETPPVHFEQIVDTVFVPNVFTPNADAYNDFFEVRSEGMSGFELIVMNRYGNPVFHTNDPYFKWQGGDESSGVYYWHIRYTNCGNVSKEVKGWVHLIR